jgi:NADH:ubiquinone reductase (H+-translocating)
VLAPFPEVLSEKANQSLVKLGVQERCGAMVKHVDQDGLTIASGTQISSIPAKTVIWAGGITASPLGKILAKRTNAETDKGETRQSKTRSDDSKLSGRLRDRRFGFGRR